MANGYQIDPLGILLDNMREQSRTLLDLTESNGRIEQRLDDGKEFHQEVRQTFREYRKELNAHGQDIRDLKKQVARKRKNSSATVLEWLEVLQRLGPLLFALTMMATALGLHVPAWVNESMQHLSKE